jgi:hypothetical protein
MKTKWYGKIIYCEIMHHCWEELFATQTEIIHAQLHDRINNLREQCSHLKEEHQLLRVIRYIDEQWPYYENEFDRELLKQPDSSEYLENEFVNELTLLYHKVQEVTVAERFWDYFFSKEVKAFAKSFAQRHSRVKSHGKLDFMKKYLEGNLPYLFRCILQNTIVNKILWGSNFQQCYVGLAPTNTEYIRKFLNLPDSPEIDCGISQVEVQELIEDRNSKGISHKSIICLIYLLIEQGVFSAKASPSEIKRGLDALIGEKVSTTSVKELNNEDNLSQFLGGVKNREVKKQLAHKLRVIADKLD